MPKPRQTPPDVRLAVMSKPKPPKPDGEVVSFKRKDGKIITFKRRKAVLKEAVGE